MEEKQFTYNDYGIRIVKCCQSCIYKTYDREGTRKCKITEQDGRWKRTTLCEKWQMNDTLAAIGSKPSQDGLRIGFATFTRGWVCREFLWEKGIAQRGGAGCIQGKFT